jgi:hypothetical protein
MYKQDFLSLACATAATVQRSLYEPFCVQELPPRALLTVVFAKHGKSKREVYCQGQGTMSGKGQVVDPYGKALLAPYARQKLARILSHSMTISPGMVLHD